MVQTLNIQEFVKLNELDTGFVNTKLYVASQSIAHFEAYCRFHFRALLKVIEPENLRLEIIGMDYIRVEFEAHIVAFMNNLHSMLDSFPYILNLFIPKLKEESTRVGWKMDFIKKYKGLDFYSLLLSFMLDERFNKVKGYVNNIKHKHLIRVANCKDHLEFEDFSYKMPYFKNDDVRYDVAVACRDNVIKFITTCFDGLLDKFFSLCNAVLEFKRVQVSL